MTETTTDTDGPEASSEPTRRAPTRMLTLGQVLALVLVTAVVTCLATLLLTDDDDGSFNEVDIGFLADMTTHHQGAITLAFDYLPNENDQTVGHTAREVVMNQSVEIATMNDLLGAAGDDADAILQDGVAMEWMGEPVEPSRMPGLATEAEFEELRAARGVDADDVFTRLMIAHHAAGIAMADHAVAHGANDKVKGFAKSMAAVQRVEIDELNERRVALGLAPIDVDLEESGGSHG